MQNLKDSFPQGESVTLLPSVPTTSLDLQSEQELIPRITSALTSFELSPPFTIQRITELILYPNRHYTNKSKYLRALDRTLTVLLLHFTI
jgi:PPP4R2